MAIASRDVDGVSFINPSRAVNQRFRFRYRISLIPHFSGKHSLAPSVVQALQARLVRCFCVPYNVPARPLYPT